MHATVIMQMEAGRLPCVNARKSRLEATARPPTTTFLRTRVGEAPAAISRSEIHPAIRVEHAIKRKTPEASRDIDTMESFSSRTR